MIEKNEQPQNNEPLNSTQPPQAFTRCGVFDLVTSETLIPTNRNFYYYPFSFQLTDNWIWHLVSV